MANHYFTQGSLAFLTKLDANNNRDWFENNKSDYEAMVRTPALQFIADMADDLAVLSPHFVAQAKKVGGSLMRVYRDIRFSKDKRPYKTNIGIQFRHEQGKDVHAPGFYVHIEPNDCFIGAGIWRPESTALGKMRDMISETPNKWQAVRDGKEFNKHFMLAGDSLIRPPRGYAKDHPMIGDLKRKDFIAIAPIDDSAALSPRFKKTVLDHFHAADDYMHFLCKALDLRY